MKIIEKISESKYIGQMESGIYEGTRFLIDSNFPLSEGGTISKKNPIQGKFQTLCELCASVYDGGEDYSEEMKQQAIDFYCGFISSDELEFDH